MDFGGGLVGVALIVLGRVAPEAQRPIPIRVEFEAPAGCSGSSQFYQGIRARTKRVALAGRGEAGLTLRVRLRQSASHVHGELQVIDEEGATDTREVDGATCAEVVEALSLTAALAVDPTAALSPAPAPPPVSPSPPSRPCPAPRVEPSSPAPEPELALEVGAQAVAAELVSPGLSFGWALSARLNWLQHGVLGPSLGVSLLHLRNDAFRTPSSALVRWTALAITGCPVRWNVAGVLRLEPCGIGIGGSLVATGRSVDRPSSSIRSWWSVGGAARVMVSMGQGTGVELLAGASIPLVGRDYVTHGPQRDIGGTPALSALSALGVAVQF